jgi:hypothetical protein
MKDFLGKEIQIRDFVIFPTRYSSSLWLKIGLITGFKIDTNFKLKPCVRSAERLYNDRWELKSKDGVIERPDRMVVIRLEDVPKDVYEIFRTTVLNTKAKYD